MLRGSLVPTLSLRPDALTGALALIGTTLTAYVYLWETIAVGVEEKAETSSGVERLRRSRVSAVIGAIFTAIILWFMLITSAATLGRHHEKVATVQDAARALRPIAGSLAAEFFAVGLITSAVVALPVLMVTTAYVVGAEFNWRRGVFEKVSHAQGFYATLAASIALAAAVDLAGVPLLGMLIAASVIGGLGTPIGLVLLVRLARNPRSWVTSPSKRGWLYPAGRSRWLSAASACSISSGRFWAYSDPAAGKRACLRRRSAELEFRPQLQPAEARGLVADHLAHR